MSNAINRWDLNEVIHLSLDLLDSVGFPVVSGTPELAIIRWKDSNGYQEDGYYWNESTFQTSGFWITMNEADSTNLPGFYYYDFVISGVEQTYLVYIKNDSIPYGFVTEYHKVQQSIPTRVDTLLTANHDAGPWTGATTAAIDSVLSAAHGSGSWEGTTASGMDVYLSANHGAGSWEGATTIAIDAALSAAHGAGNWEGDSAATIDSLLSSNHGAGSWQGTTPGDIDTLLSSTHGAGLWEGTTPAAIDALLTTNHGAGNWNVSGIDETTIAAEVDSVLTSAHGSGQWITTPASGVNVYLYEMEPLT